MVCITKSYLTNLSGSVLSALAAIYRCSYLRQRIEFRVCVGYGSLSGVKPGK